MIHLIDLETVTVFRGSTDNKGNVNKAAHGAVEVAFAWGEPNRVGGGSAVSDRQESASMDAQVFAVRGTDLRARDRIQRSNGERYMVVGPPAWWQPNELEVFGASWVVFQVEVMNG